jgi:hypothetical protein
MRGEELTGLATSGTPEPEDLAKSRAKWDYGFGPLEADMMPTSSNVWF